MNLMMVVSALALALNARATEVRVTTSPVRHDSGAAEIAVNARVEWRNAWRNARNHDAVWVFVKLRAASGGNWRHAPLLDATAAAGPPALACTTSGDRIGAFCGAAQAYRGDIARDITLRVDATRLPDDVRNARAVEARVFAIEMVYVPAGPFYIGDPDTASVGAAAFYRSDARGRHDGPYRIESEAELRVAPDAGALYYTTRSPEYEGDRRGPIPAGFPKGTRAFYVMKYEVLQGEYGEFLNHIPATYAYFRAIHAGPGYHEGRGTITLERGRYAAARPYRPANWISWDDGTAFADWAGLRPMTEFEFTKAARGPERPVAGDFPWGTSSRERLLRRMGPDDDLMQSGAADESSLSDATRDALGASWYWVMDLAGSVWERVVTPGHPVGRRFQGTHGDGRLREYGLATNEDWPLGDHEAGGYGYRGGGYYEQGMPDRGFNPYSPVAWRNFGSWGGAPRAIAYGFRAVRSAER